jgi:hypothetical protein
MAIHEGGPDDLRASIRAQLRTGALPRIAGRATVGPGQGNRICACCRLVIRPSIPEYELQDTPGVYAHRECFSTWVTESYAWQAEQQDARTRASPA